jgi:hypothetical protein
MPVLASAGFRVIETLTPEWSPMPEQSMEVFRVRCLTVPRDSGIESGADFRAEAWSLIVRMFLEIPITLRGSCLLPMRIGSSTVGPSSSPKAERRKIQAASKDVFNNIPEATQITLCFRLFRAFSLA